MSRRKEMIGAEFIGRVIKIIAAKNKANIGLQGTVIDETKQTFKIKTAHGETKTIIKGNATIETTIKGRKVRIEGSLLQKRPEERIKAR